MLFINVAKYIISQTLLWYFQSWIFSHSVKSDVWSLFQLPSQILFNLTRSVRAEETKIRFSLPFIIKPQLTFDWIFFLILYLFVNIIQFLGLITWIMNLKQFLSRKGFIKGWLRSLWKGKHTFLSVQHEQSECLRNNMIFFKSSCCDGSL